MLHISTNIRKIRKLLNRTQFEFADVMGVSLAMQKSYEGGKANPDTIYLEKLSELTGFRVSDLLNNDLSVREIVEKVEPGTGEVRLEGYAPTIKISQLNEPENFIEKRRSQKNHTAPSMVPFIPVKAQAGYVKALDQEMYLDNLEKYALPPGVSGHGAIWRYWEIEGDSMLPVFRSGDIILTSFVHPMDWENIRNFYTYVIVTQERVIIKRVYCKNRLEWVLISENEENYPQQLLHVEDIKEVWVYRKTWATRAEPSKQFEIKI
jgi:phage repressor protein C with HTH and peptisase S24 domain